MESPGFYIQFLEAGDSSGVCSVGMFGDGKGSQANGRNIRFGADGGRSSELRCPAGSRLAAAASNSRLQQPLIIVPASIFRSDRLQLFSYTHRTFRNH